MVMACSASITYILGLNNGCRQGPCVNNSSPTEFATVEEIDRGDHSKHNVDQSRVLSPGSLSGINLLEMYVDNRETSMEDLEHKPSGIAKKRNDSHSS